MIFVDSGAWIALALKLDQYHRTAKAQHKRLRRAKRKYVFSDYVLCEVVTHLYRVLPAASAEGFISTLLTAVDEHVYELVHISADQFRRTWQLRRKYADKPDISFVDFTSMVVMQDLAVADIFTGDEHFEQVGLGFRVLP